MDFAYWCSLSGGGYAINGATPSSISDLLERTGNNIFEGKKIILVGRNTLDKMAAHEI